MTTYQILSVLGTFLGVVGTGIGAFATWKSYSVNERQTELEKNIKQNVSTHIDYIINKGEFKIVNNGTVDLYVYGVLVESIEEDTSRTIIRDDYSEEPRIMSKNVERDYSFGTNEEYKEILNNKDRLRFTLFVEDIFDEKWKIVHKGFLDDGMWYWSTVKPKQVDWEAKEFKNFAVRME